MKLRDSLWNLNADIAKLCLKHPFVQGLGSGALDAQAFRRYVDQDAFFLRAFFQAYALAAARSDDLEQGRVFHELMGGVLDELKLHARYAESLDIDIEHTKPHRATSAYTDFLLRTAWHGNLDEILAAMVPCMRLYMYLGGELSAHLRPEHPYEDWIKTYSSDDFGGFCDGLESLLDRVALDSPAVRDAYRYAMQCELAFFSAPLETNELTPRARSNPDDQTRTKERLP
jgi:thiaminase/transcriptional activator TenA